MTCATLPCRPPPPPHPTTEPTDPAWPPASARQVATALVASLQQATSSARLLLLGCFQCHALKPGCWRRQDEQDGAWFDCDKLQAEHPYCYVNPVALHEAPPLPSRPYPATPPSRNTLHTCTTPPHTAANTYTPHLPYTATHTCTPFIPYTTVVTHTATLLSQPLCTDNSSRTKQSPCSRYSPRTHSPVHTHAPVHHSVSPKAPGPVRRHLKSSNQHDVQPKNSSSSSNHCLRSLTSSSSLVHKHSEKPLANGRVDIGRENHNFSALNSEVGLMIKEDVVRYTNSEFRSPLVESFAAKLEADLRKLEYDRQRAEGELVRMRGQGADDDDDDDDEATTKELYRGDREVDVFRNGNLETTFGCVDFEGEVQSECEVWEATELEDAFECYNMAAFYSYGGTFTTTDKFSSKSRGEKYEEVFPVTFHNNNTIKVFKPAAESDSPLLVTSKDQGTIENECKIVTTKENDSVSQEELKLFINFCIDIDSADALGIPCHADRKIYKVRDRVIHFGSKSFNKMLIYNLVKSVMSESRRHYSHSLPSSEKYLSRIVQSRVIAVLQEKKDTGRLNQSGLQVFRNSSLLSATENESYQNQIQARRLVDSVVAAEVRAEDKQWHDFSREEDELKEAIATEIFDDLICDTTDFLTLILTRKMTK